MADDKELVLSTAMSDLRMSHWHQDAFLATHPDWRYGSMAVFDFDANGSVKSVDFFGDTFARVREGQ